MNSSKRNLPREALTEMAETIGSDVPFFLFQSAAVCKGHGEMVVATEIERTIFDPVAETSVCCLNSMGIFALARFSRNSGDSLRSARNSPNRAFVNDLERPVFEKFVFLAQLKMWLFNQPEVGAALMSGSGSTIFAVMRDHADADSVAKRAKVALDPELWTCACETR